MRYQWIRRNGLAPVLAVKGDFNHRWKLYTIDGHQTAIIIGMDMNNDEVLL